MQFKKTAVLLIAAILCVSLISCGSNETPPASTDEPYTPTTPAVTTQPVPTGPSSTTNDPVTPVPPTTDDPSVTTVPATTTDPVVTTDPAVSTAPVTPVEPVVTTQPADDTTAEPQQKDPAASDLVASGTIKGDTGTKMDIYLDWKVEQKQGSTDLFVYTSLRLEHYSMYKSASSGIFKVNNAEYSFRSAPIDTLQDEGFVSDLIGQGAFVLQRGAGESVTLDLAASWYYGGTYGTLNIEWLNVAGTITISE